MNSPVDESARSAPWLHMWSSVLCMDFGHVARWGKSMESPEFAPWIQPCQPLGTLAEQELLSEADVVVLSGIAPGTISRLWHDRQWLDHISGAVLQRLIAAVPNLTQYVVARSNASRLGKAVQSCQDLGLELASEPMALCTSDVRSVPEVATVLNCAEAVMRMDWRRATAILTRCWGSIHDASLDAIFSPPPQGLFRNATVLLDASDRLLNCIDTRSNSLNATVGHGILVHKLTKWAGQVPASLCGPGRSSAFDYRSSIIGTLLKTDDVEVSVTYHRRVDTTPLLRRNELWSMVSYCADIRPAADFSLSPGRILEKTAAEVINDITHRGDAYLHYLCNTAIPVLFHYDRSFGRAIEQLRHTLGGRLDRGIADKRARSAATALLASLQ